jgi:hypothetical protein
LKGIGGVLSQHFSGYKHPGWIASVPAKIRTKHFPDATPFGNSTFSPPTHLKKCAHFLRMFHYASRQDPKLVSQVGSWDGLQFVKISQFKS